MSIELDKVDAYRKKIFHTLMFLAPLTAVAAAACFTISRALGFFETVKWIYVIIFDLTCFAYSFVAFFVKKRGITVDGRIDEGKLKFVDYVIDTLVLLQWNIISYVFPTESFWGFAPMFVLLTAFMFRTKAVFVEICGMIVSIALSWVMVGDALLPPHDEYFEVNMGLRIVALAISFIVIYVLTYFAENFTRIVKEGYHSLENKNKKLEGNGQAMIDFTADVIEARDATTGSHVKRLKAYTKVLAEEVAKMYPEYGLDKDKIEEITEACALHDVGKIGIADSILLKPGPLTDEEREIMKTHTTKGAEIIDKLPESISAEYKSYCRDICLYHHERDDGSGYPMGLKGDEIPISAQIVAIVDCFDALTNERPYKHAFPKKVAIDMLLNDKCGKFSDKIKEAIKSCEDKLIIK